MSTKRCVKYVWRLLEADVNFKVVKDFIAKVKERAIGQEVAKSFTPGMVVIDIVNKELTELMGGTHTSSPRQQAADRYYDGRFARCR